MTSVLIVRPSSMGDVVYALSLVADLRKARPDAAITWVAEEAFAPLVRLDPRVARVIPLALRRWRHRPFAPSNWREFAAFRALLRAQRHDVILDLQEQVKGALICRLARGVRHGFDRHSIREPAAAWFDDVHHRIARRQHFMDKCRALAGAALGYEVAGPPRWQFDVPPTARARPAGPYAIVFHATSRADKLWPEQDWRALISRFAASGLATLVPWGSAEEEARSARLVAGIAQASAPPRQTLAELASLIRNAEIVAGVDTGLTHFAAALGTPTVAVFTATDPSLAGVSRTGPHAQDVGDAGGAPSFDQVAAAAARALQTVPRC